MIILRILTDFLGSLLFLFYLYIGCSGSLLQHAGFPVLHHLPKSVFPLDHTWLKSQSAALSPPMPPHPWTLSRLPCHLLSAFGCCFTHSHSHYLPGPGDTRVCTAGADLLLSRAGSGCEAPTVHRSPSVLRSVFHELVHC